jgi:hypothetical protein
MKGREMENVYTTEADWMHIFQRCDYIRSQVNGQILNNSERVLICTPLFPTLSFSPRSHSNSCNNHTNPAKIYRRHNHLDLKELYSRIKMGTVIKVVNN